MYGTYGKIVVMSLLPVVIISSIILLAYVAAPPIVALLRGHPERTLIYKLSPLTLLSFLLWWALLVWAASDQRDDAIISTYVAKLRGSGWFVWVIGLLVLIGATGGFLAVLR